MISAEGEHLKEDASNYNKAVYENPAVTVDIAIYCIQGAYLKVLLIQRKHPPFRDCWAIPGGFVNIKENETLEETARRELFEETNLKGVYLEQLKTYGDPSRDPRMRIITVAYFALMPGNFLQNNLIRAKDDATKAEWFSLRDLPPLAFDHKNILEDLLIRLIGKISYTPIAFSLLPEKFTWNQLREVYEIILGKELVPANFRRKISSMYKLKILRAKKKDGRGRPSTYIRYIGLKDF